MLKAVSNNEEHPEEGLIPVQPVSLDIWDKKYRLKSRKVTLLIRMLMIPT